MFVFDPRIPGFVESDNTALIVRHFVYGYALQEPEIEEWAKALADFCDEPVSQPEATTSTST